MGLPDFFKKWRERLVGVSSMIVLVAGLVATLTLALLADWGIQQDNDRRFRHLARQLTQAMESRMDIYQNALVHTRALFMADPEPSREEFHDFIESLNLQRKYPGIRGVNYSVKIAANERSALEKRMRAQSFPGFRVWPEPDDEDELFSIIYLEPQLPSIQKALGYNSFADVTRRDAMVRARDTGEPAVSHPVKVMQDSDPSAPRTGFLLYVPVYRPGAPVATVEQRREALTGFIHGLFRTDQLFGAVATAFARRSALDVRIYDGEIIDPDRLLFASSEGESVKARLGERLFSRMIPIDVGGVRWSVHIRSLPGFESAASRFFPWIILFAGLLTTLLLFRAARSAATVIAEKQRLLDEARAINRSKDDFLAMLSHELRTPLGVIQGHAEVLMDSACPPAMRDSIEAIHRNARVQTRIIDDLLEVSSIVTGKLRLDPHPVDVSALIDAAVESVRFAAQAKSVRLDVRNETGLVVNADATRMQQVIWNLLSNAIKFTPAGGRVEIFTVQVGSSGEIRVRDDGQGIDSAFLPHVFDRFRQQDSGSTRRFGGLGLGLAIVQNLVHMHGGRVEARSDGPGHGAEFVVTLPLLDSSFRSSMPVAPAPRAAGARLDGHRILVVDDDDDSRAMIVKAFEQAGATVQGAGSASEGLTAFREFRPELIVSDIGMPGEDGYSFIRKIREEERLLGRPLAPAIALTAYAQVSDQLATLRAGFQNHLVKPVDTHELTEAADLLARRKSPSAFNSRPDERRPEA